jgi:hypothetical protein
MHIEKFLERGLGRGTLFSKKFSPDYFLENASV